MSAEPFDVLTRWAQRRHPLNTSRGSDGQWGIVSPDWGGPRSHALIVAEPGIALLWALALEMDEQEVTLTCGRVCRTCSGRGEYLASADGDHPSTALIQYYLWPRDPTTGSHAVSVRPCGCVTPTSVIYGPPSSWSRPDTVSLEWLVRKLAAASPFVAGLESWPPEWVVALDQREAIGDTSWQAQWWRAFAEWCQAGAIPDADALAGLLETRTAGRSKTAPPLPVEPRTSHWSDELCDQVFDAVRGQLPEHARLRSLWYVTDRHIAHDADHYGHRLNTAWMCGFPNGDTMTFEASARLSTSGPISHRIQVRDVTMSPPARTVVQEVGLAGIRRLGWR